MKEENSTYLKMVLGKRRRTGATHATMNWMRQSIEAAEKSFENNKNNMEERLLNLRLMMAAEALGSESTKHERRKLKTDE